MESDFAELNPKDLPITKLDNEVGKEFSNLEGVVVIVQLDDDLEGQGLPSDIRDPKVMEFLVRLNQNLRKENFVDSVASVGQVFNRRTVCGGLMQVRQRD